jgi:hypothetical protein
MINYFHKINKFYIDHKKLYDEWYEVATKHDMFERTHHFVSRRSLDYSPSIPVYYKLLINYPTSMDQNIDPVWLDRSEDNDTGSDTTFSIDNINTNFKNSYTESVVKHVDKFITSKYKTYKTTVVKYAALRPNSLINTHVDKRSIPRFFLTVNAPQGCFMEVCGDRHSLSDAGALFKMICNAPHSPINESDQFRVMIIFDVAPVT